MKKFLLYTSYKIGIPNILIQNEIVNHEFLSTDTRNAMDRIEINFDLEDFNAFDCYEETSEYKENVLNYIAGFIQKKILKNEKCIQCRQFLATNQISTPFLNLRNLGGLNTPAETLLHIVKLTEVIVTDFHNKHNVFSQKDIFYQIFVRAIHFLDIKNQNFLSELNCHAFDCKETLSHRNSFIKKVVQCFLTLKLRHMSKLKNEDICKARIRHKYNKLVLFSNQ